MIMSYPYTIETEAQLVLDHPFQGTEAGGIVSRRWFQGANDEWFLRVWAKRNKNGMGEWTDAHTSHRGVKGQFDDLPLMPGLIPAAERVAELRDNNAD